MVTRQQTRRPAAGNKFQYRARTAEQMQKRASQQGGSRDPYLNTDVKFYTPGGDNKIRILPPTWPDAEHFGYELHIHYDIGPDRSSYLCLDKMKGTAGECPICRERADAEKKGEKEYADGLKPGKRVAVFVIDRNKPKEGPLLWSMPWTVDRDICAQAVDKDSGEVFQVDDPENGYDVLFGKEGSGTTTKYKAIQIARRSSPLSDDPDLAEQWLKWVMEHPIPDMLKLYPPEHIEKVFSGEAPASKEADTTVEEEAPPARAARATSAAATPAPATARRALRREPEPEPQEEPPFETLTWDEVHKLGEEELLNLIEEREIKPEELPEGADTMPLEELAAAVCGVLGIEKPKPAAASGGGSSKLRERLSRLTPK